MVGRLALCTALGLFVLGQAGTALAARVVVFPLDARAVSEASARVATERVVATLRGITDLKVIEPKSVEQKLGVNLTEQARSCNYDVFCLVEVGEILQVERILIGHVRRPEGKDSSGLELKLIVLDVAKAVIAEVLIWRLPDSAAAGWQDAVEAAARRLFSAPDALVDLVLDPANAKLSFYGEPINVPAAGQPLRLWSGTYYARVESPGYHPLEVKVVVPPNTRTKVPLTLEPDPLYVPPDRQPKDKLAQPFERTSRREGSGISAKEVGVKAEEAEDPVSSALTNPIPWVVAGGGVGLVVLGSVVMSSAQGNYNELSGQARYAPGMTATVDVAVQVREDAQSSYTLGSALALAGVAAVVGAGAWMIIAATVAPDPTPAVTTTAAPKALSPELSAAAHELVEAAFRGAR